MRRFTSLCAVFLTACGSADAPGGSTGPTSTSTADWSKAVPWTTYQGNNARTGYQPVAIDTAVLKLRWQDSLTAVLGIFPVVEGGGNVYAAMNNIGGGQSGVIALDISTGVEKWRAAVPANTGFFPPVYADGIVYLQPQSGTFWAFDAVTGATRYSVPVSSGGSYYGVAVDGSTIYMGCALPPFGGLCGRRASNGDSLWVQPVGYVDQWAPVVSNGAVYAYTAGGDAEYPKDLRAFDGPSGQPLFQVSDPDSLDFDRPGVSAIGSMNDLIATQGQRLLSFDLTAHKINWIGGNGGGGTIAIANGVIYTFGLPNGTVGVEALNESDGTLRWLWPLTADFNTGFGYLMVTNNLLFVSSGFTTHAVDLATHNEVWSVKAGGRLSLSAQGVLLMAGPGGMLSAVTAK